MLGGGAWPFLVRGVICLVNSDNERDLNLLNRYTGFTVGIEGGNSGGLSMARDIRSGTELGAGWGNSSGFRFRVLVGITS